MRTGIGASVPLLASSPLSVLTLFLTMGGCGSNRRYEAAPNELVYHEPGSAAAAASSGYVDIPEQGNVSSPGNIDVAALSATTGPGYLDVAADANVGDDFEDV